jgi:proteasome accessory factor A
MPREDEDMVDYERVPKLCGADVELGNFIQGLGSLGGTGREASRALLREIHGHGGRSGADDPQDWGRKYLATNGGCVYIDLDHLECCLPEVLGAHEHVAAWHAMLRIARQALFDASARLPEGQTLHVLVNNSDGKGNSYGSHLDFLVTRRAWENLFARRMHYLLYLAAFQVSSIIYTGQGKVGSENGRPAVPFQLSQRADFFEMLVGEQTTYRRPIVNARDESLCGRAANLARLHCIFFDNSLCHGSALLKVGTMQMMLALIEAERVDAKLILEDPVAAVHVWSHDPGLAETMPMLAGSALTAIELQRLFLEEAKRFEAARGFEGVVPRAGEILALWEDTLDKLAARDLAALVPRLDWVLKLHILGQALERRPQLGWDVPEIKHLDHLYGSLDPGEGLYWAYDARGAVEQHVSEDEIARFEHEPPDDTRAFGRAMLLRAAGPQGVYDVDWDRIRFREPGGGYWPVLRTLAMDDPLGFTKTAIGEVVGGGTALDDTLDALGASAPAYDAKPAIQTVPTVHVARRGNGGAYE